MGRAIARRSTKRLIQELINNDKTRQQLFNRMSKMIHNEIATMCSNKVNSVLLRHSADDIMSFSWSKLHEELKTFAPVFVSVLQSCARTKQPRVNTNGVIGMCAALLLKHRYTKMCLVQKIVSLILYAGHAGKQVELFL